ncbi:MAG: AAA family ATPase [Desulfobacteraceae bacterium A6]|nr:MAG: AAA family ATPase [Desulfobacteraceae bacterium A6]
MKFYDIPADILNVRVKPTDIFSDSLGEQPVFSVSPFLSRPGEFEIRLKDSVIFVKPTIGSDIRRLGNELAIGRAMLAQLANPATDGSIGLQIAFFTGECLEMGDVEIGVDEYVEQAVAKIARQKRTGKKLYEYLERLCCLVHGDQPFFFLTAGPAIDDALKSEPEEIFKKESEESSDTEEEEESDGDTSQSILETSVPQSAPTRKNSFCVTGDGIRFVATETRLPDWKSVFIATRLAKIKNKPDRALRLAKGKLKFVDWTQTGQIQLLVKAQMSALIKDDGSYLKKWDEFGDLEGKLLLKHAREIGALQYCDMNPNRDGTVTVRIAQASDSALNALAANDAEDVEVVDDLPDYLKNPDLKFAEFMSGVEQEAEIERLLWKHKKERKEANLHFKVSDYDAVSRSLTIKTEHLPPSGTLILSLAGEIAQIKRRINARKAILKGRAANSQLGLLIEEKGEIAPTRASHPIPPLNAFVRNKVFPNNPPTSMQKKAIEVALNTPDIALIQGPPGTGKTTVIAAILERLNEMADKRGTDIKGMVLLTGFQHDAVENMIDRLSLNSIPVPKFGGRSGDDEDDFSFFEKKLEDWCAKISIELRSKNPQIVEIEKETEIKNICLQYNKAPTQILAANLANKIADLGITILGEESSRWAANLAKKLSIKKNLNAESNPSLNAVRRLRIKPVSFADDGPERATDALDDLKDVLEDNERELMDKASLWRTEDGIPPFLNDLAVLKKKLLIRFTDPPVFRVEKQNDEIIALAEEAIKKIRVAGFSAKDTKSAALAEFLAELESNPYGMIDAVSDYSFAFAATCQQSVNRQMQKQKGITGNDPEQKMEYEYVIVDEAARVSPRDLMVPMAQGKRIILVGDHRQLPHIIDEEIAGQMEKGETGEEESDWLKKSMFQYLFSERLKALEQKDKWPRRVTLDTQYRMHPLLGDFISRNFYERFAPSEKFGSDRKGPESDFAHNLLGTENKPVIWLDIPEAQGKHQPSGTSWTRPAESAAIARQLQAWMNSKEGESLSFGVISFYKAQAELIKKQLGKITDDDRKLRIGTVDSFQGMEFDVVFLSMVRTMPQNWKPRTDEKKQQAYSLFGRLCLYNLLNVSMSRQKRLLAVAGDSALLRNDLAAEFIPGLVDFFNLCQTEGRVLPCR